MSTYLTLGDSIGDLVVTRVTEKSCWLNDKRMSWDSVKKLPGKMQTFRSPNIKIDFTNKEAVLEYFDSFREWSFYMSNGDVSKESRVMRVEGNLIFSDGEYYLPAPGGDNGTQTMTHKQVYADGFYEVVMLKRGLGWYNTIPAEKVNIYYVRGRVNMEPSIADVQALKPNTDELYLYPYGGKLTFEYSHSGRNGVSIWGLGVKFPEFFKEVYCTSRWGNNKPFIHISDEMMDKIMYDDDDDVTIGKEFFSFENELSRVLNKCQYNINDNDEWGEYSVSSLVINRHDSKPFFDLIDERLKQLK